MSTTHFAIRQLSEHYQLPEWQIEALLMALNIQVEDGEDGRRIPRSSAELLHADLQRCGELIPGTPTL